MDDAGIVIIPAALVVRTRSPSNSACGCEPALPFIRVSPPGISINPARSAAIIEASRSAYPLPFARLTLSTPSPPAEPTQCVGRIWQGRPSPTCTDAQKEMAPYKQCAHVPLPYARAAACTSSPFARPEGFYLPAP